MNYILAIDHFGKLVIHERLPDVLFRGVVGEHPCQFNDLIPGSKVFVAQTRAHVIMGVGMDIIRRKQVQMIFIDS